MGPTDKKRTGNLRALPLSYPGIGAGGGTRTRDLVVINDNPILRPVEKAATDKERYGKQSVARLRGVRTRSSRYAGLYQITHDQRPVGKTRWTKSAVAQKPDGRHRTCVSRAFARTLCRCLASSAFGFVFRAIIHNERPIEIGQEAGIRTRTVAFTTRNAAVTPQS